MAHIIERFIIHFFCSMAMVFLFRLGLQIWRNNNTKTHPFIPPEKGQQLLLAAALVWGVFSLREPWDVHAVNNTVIKSYFDIASWLLGAAVSAWGLYRRG